MPISKLKLKNIRNLSLVELDLDPTGFNIVVGKNGSGKTSLLEAINILSCGRSFRTSDQTQIIQRDKESYIIYAEILDGDRFVPVGVSRQQDGVFHVKHQGCLSKVSTLHRLLPVRAINPIGSSELINGGPSSRRDFLDWGLFHVKQSYWNNLKRFNKLLKQRNAALKMRCSDEELNEWDHQFSLVSNFLDRERVAYIEQWQQQLKSIVSHISVFKGLQVGYYPGWDRALGGLQHLLARERKKERMSGYSLFGPHRADMLLKSDSWPAKEQYSRGQQKLLAVAMYLAQGLLLKKASGQHPLFLIDDFSSELDETSQRLLLDVLKDQKCQIVLTSLTPIDYIKGSKTWVIDEGAINDENSL